VYLPYRPLTLGAGIPPLAETSSMEDELRREIRALKGLVLNRYYFLAFIPKKLFLNIYSADDPSCPQFQGPLANSYNNMNIHCSIIILYDCEFFLDFPFCKEKYL
jgi:hypothetical protein